MIARLLTFKALPYLAVGALALLLIAYIGGRKHGRSLEADDWAPKLQAAETARDNAKARAASCATALHEVNASTARVQAEAQERKAYGERMAAEAARTAEAAMQRTKTLDARLKAERAQCPAGAMLVCGEPLR